MAGVPAGRLSIEIVAEIARLQQDLDKAKRAVNAASKDIEKSVGAANDNFGRMTKMSGNAAFAMRNLGFQVQDVITQLSLGQAPMKVFAAQGFQIVDALGQLRREAAAANTSLASMIFGSFGKAGPLIIAAAAAVTAFAGALKIVQDDLNETGEATLSYSDVALGAFDAVRAYVVDTLGPAFEWLADMVGQAWGYIADIAKKQANFIIGVMVAVPKTIYAAFTTLPAAIAELFVNMANGAIKAIEDLVNKAIGGLNSFAGMVNNLLGTSIGGVGNVSFGRIENNFKGAGSRAGIALAQGVASGFDDHWGKIVETIRPFSEARRAARLAKDAEDAGGKAGRAGGKAGGKAMAAEWVDPFADTWKASTAAIVDILQDMNKTVEDIAKNGAADLEDALKDIGQNGAQHVADLNEQMQILYERAYAVVDVLGRMGGIGGIFGQIGSVLTSRDPITAMLGMGGIGTIAGSLLNGSATTEKLSLAFYDGLKRAGMQDDNLAAKIGGTLANVFQGAAVGGAVGGILGGGKAGALGATAGGALGQSLGSSISALGKFGGPIGAVVGSILGNVLGGMLTSTKRGGATIGAGGVSGTWGNSQSRIGAATDLGGGAVNALQQLADALGVSLGSFSSSVSVRKNNLRFDPTGSGISKTSKGAIDFGQDEAALLKAIISDAISDGAFAGLSEGFKNYLTSGDVESRLQDVLNIKAIQQEAAQMRDPQGFALSELDKWRTSMLAIATATGEGMADIEYLYGERRKEILEVANDNALDIERERQALLIQIAELEGRSTEALAMARQLELEASDASLHPLMQRIYQLQDEATAAALAAQAAAEAAQAERDLAAARQAAAQAARSVYEKQVSIEAQIMTLQGNAAGALRVQRELELFAAEATIRPLLLRKYALEDEATAAALAAAEAEKLAEAQRQAAAEAARLAEEQAARAKAIADEIGGLNRQWLELTGQTEKLRALDLAALLSDEARTLQQQIWDYTDALEAQKAAEEAATKAAEDYTRRLEDARNALSQAYERESGALQQTIDKFRDFAATIRDFRLGLIAANDNSLGGSRSRFLQAATQASMGRDVGAFSGRANEFLGSALNNARTRSEYQDQVGFVLRTAMGVERSLGAQADGPQRQLDLLTEQVSQFIDLNENVLTVEQAIKNLQDIEAEGLPVIANTVSVGLDNVAAKIETATVKAENAEQMSRTALEAILKAAQGTERQLARIRIEGGAVTVRTDSDTPIITEAAA